MRALAFWKTVTADRADFLGRLIALLAEHRIRFCVVGGQAVNAYADPVVSLDLDLVIAVDQLAAAEGRMGREFRMEHSLRGVKVSMAGSDLRVQVQTDPRSAAFVDRAEERDLLGIRLPVAQIEDVLRGKIWAVRDPGRRASKRQKDLADIARLLEARPGLREQVPSQVLSMLL